MMSQGLMAGLGFVFWVIVARYYTEAELGYSSAIISALGLVALIGQIGMDSFLIRFMAASIRPARLLNTCLTSSALVTTMVGLIAAAGMPVWAPSIAFVSAQPAFLAAFVTFGVASALSNMTGAAHIAGRKSKYLTYKDAVFGTTKLMLPFLFLQRFHAFGIVASWGVATALGLMASLFVFLPRVIPSYSPRPELGARLVRRAWGFSGMSYAVSIMAAAPQFLMPIIVINALGPRENAFFYIAWAIATLTFAVPHSIGRSLFAEGAYDKRRLRRDIRRAVGLGLALTIPAAVFVWFLGVYLLLAFGATYAERSIELLRILMLAGIPLSVIHPFFTALRILGRMRELIAWQGTLTVTLLITSHLLLPTYGAEVLGWLWIVAHSSLAALVVTIRGGLWLRE